MQRPRNIYMAEAFCNENANGDLYHPDKDFKMVVDFAKKHFVKDFYVGITDKNYEGYFQYFNGSVFPKHLQSLWKTGQPNNAIPTLNQICEPDGEDFVLARKGKLEDVRGILKYPFMCEHSVDQSTSPSLFDICTACRTFVGVFNVNFNPLTVTHLINLYCEKNSDLLKKYIGNICSAVSNFGYEIVNSLNNDYFIDYEICNIFQNCNFDDSVNGTVTCNVCKHLILQVKDAVLHSHDSNPVTKELPIFEKVLPYICETIGFDCTKLNFIALLKRFFTHQLDEDFIESFCVAFEQC